MTTQQEKVLKPKPGLLELAKQLGNVSYSCKIMAYSRATFGVHLSTGRRSYSGSAPLHCYSFIQLKSEYRLGRFGGKLRTGGEVNALPSVRSCRTPT